MGIREGKFFLYRSYGYVVAGGIVISLAIGWFGETTEQWRLALAAAGAFLSLAYFIQKQKLDETKLFKEIFHEFNERYARLMDPLSAIAEEAKTEDLDSDDKGILLDYFNLCGEEYLMYREGYIFPSVWTSWSLGMQEYYDAPRIREFWNSELERGSYYGLQLGKG